MNGRFTAIGGPWCPLSNSRATVPIPPSVRASVALPPGLDQLVLSCLAKNPAQRPDAAELGRALAAIPVEPWTEQQAAHWWRAAANPPVAAG